MKIEQELNRHAQANFSLRLCVSRVADSVGRHCRVLHLTADSPAGAHDVLCTVDSVSQASAQASAEASAAEDGQAKPAGRNPA